MTTRSRSYASLSDRELVARLGIEEDELPRAAVDEFLRRADAMVGPLSAICLDRKAWLRDGRYEDDWAPIPPEAWRPAHATLVLGAIGGERVLDALMVSLEEGPNFMLNFTDEIPLVLGAQGPVALRRLALYARAHAYPFARWLACESLGALAARHLEVEDEALNVLHAIAADRHDEWEARTDAAYVLCKFARPGDRKLLEWLASGEDAVGDTGFSRWDVRNAYDGTSRVGHYRRDWLEFYSPSEIARRRALNAEWKGGRTEWRPDDPDEPGWLDGGDDDELL